MADAVLILAIGAVAAASVFGAYQGWRAIIKNPRLMGSPWERPDTASGWAKQLSLWLVGLVGLALGVWLATKVDR